MVAEQQPGSPGLLALAVITRCRHRSAVAANGEVDRDRFVGLRRAQWLPFAVVESAAEGDAGRPHTVRAGGYPRSAAAARAPVLPGPDFHPLVRSKVQNATWHDGRRVAYANHG